MHKLNLHQSKLRNSSSCTHRKQVTSHIGAILKLACLEVKGALGHVALHAPNTQTHTHTHTHTSTHNTTQPIPNSMEQNWDKHTCTHTHTSTHKDTQVHTTQFNPHQPMLALRGSDLVLPVKTIKTQPPKKTQCLKGHKPSRP